MYLRKPGDKHYDRVVMPTHPRAATDKTVPIHIVTAEYTLGRHLKDGEIVHHKDKDRHNNKPSNLMVLDSTLSHYRIHHGAKAIKLSDGSYTAYVDPNVKVKEYINCSYTYSKKLYKCERCGKYKVASRRAKLCVDCYNLFRSESSKRPSKEELIKTAKSMKKLNFCELGRMYGVSSTAVHKWFKYYDILL